MKAIRIGDYGDRSVLRCEEAPEPALLPDDVLIRVHAAGVNPADCQFRRGDYRAYAPLQMPAILGWDVAGSVEQVGPAVHGFAHGDAVYAMCDMTRPGAYAELVAVRADYVAPAPASIPLAHAAAIPLAALTAWQALVDLGALRAGQSVLIHGAAGSVGLFATQLAKNRGANVVATASPANHERLRSFGADRCLDYSTPHWTQALTGLDLVLDGAAGASREQLWSVLREGGMLVAIAMPPADPVDASARGYRAATAQVIPDGARLREITALVDAGKLQVLIDSEFPFVDAAAAHARSESRHAKGKILLRPPQSHHA